MVFVVLQSLRPFCWNRNRGLNDASPNERFSLTRPAKRFLIIEKLPPGRKAVKSNSRVPLCYGTKININSQIPPPRVKLC